MSRAEIDFINMYAQCNEAGIAPKVDRRTMHWAVQRVDEILASADTLPGMTHADAAAAMIELGVSFERVRQLLAGERRIHPT